MRQTHLGGAWAAATAAKSAAGLGQGSLRGLAAFPGQPVVASRPAPLGDRVDVLPRAADPPGLLKTRQDRVDAARWERGPARDLKPVVLAERFVE
jgi:hypothetical protein